MNIRATHQRQSRTAVLLTALCLAKLVFEQTTAFGYQGKLTDAGNPPTATST